MPARREDPWLHLARGDSCHRQCLPPVLDSPACPFHLGVLLAGCLGEQGSFFLGSVLQDVALQVAFPGY